MTDYIARFSAAPASYKKSFCMLAIAWICHPVYIYLFFSLNQAVDQAEREIWRMAIVSGCLLFLLFLVKKWARALVVMGTCFIVVYDIFVLAVAAPNQSLRMLCVAVAVFATVGTYWLFVKETRGYFTRMNPKAESGDPPAPRTGSQPPKP